MAWAFQRRIARNLSNPYHEAEFQYKLYEKIDPETSKSIIAENNRTNHSI